MLPFTTFISLPLFNLNSAKIVMKWIELDQDMNVKMKWIRSELIIMKRWIKEWKDEGNERNNGKKRKN